MKRSLLGRQGSRVQRPFQAEESAHANTWPTAEKNITHRRECVEKQDHDGYGSYAEGLKKPALDSESRIHVGGEVVSLPFSFS